ncbi:hypothetical protein N0V93_009840 [Gnomoniopsis smithogilvyi]|uniref:Azaphilone pigments biosynthesis cluster protein L N-terminal domain-containing protein n=1 Tax=Gnomoniopsis smithogilvyi TaxID=1191159 RepID=A0A9W8YHV7_9PEZI|nr:hypothetical protein N0V93_009840 [Gnomoniopsis smithogilvyi]
MSGFEAIFGVVSGGAGLVSLGMQLTDSAMRLRKLYRTAKTAPKALNELSEKLETMVMLLHLLNQHQSLQIKNLIQPVIARYIAECERCSQDVQQLIEKIQGRVEEQKVRGRIYFVFKEQDIRELSNRLEEAKSSLTMAYTIQISMSTQYLLYQNEEHKKAQDQMLSLGEKVLDQLQCAAYAGHIHICRYLWSQTTWPDNTIVLERALNSFAYGHHKRKYMVRAVVPVEPHDAYRVFAEEPDFDVDTDFLDDKLVTYGQDWIKLGIEVLKNGADASGVKTEASRSRATPLLQCIGAPELVTFRYERNLEKMLERLHLWINVVYEAGLDLCQYGAREAEVWKSLSTFQQADTSNLPCQAVIVEQLLFGPRPEDWTVVVRNWMPPVNGVVFELRIPPGSFPHDPRVPTKINWQPAAAERNEGHWEKVTARTTRNLN